MKLGQQVGVDLVPAKSGGQPWHFDTVVSAGPKLAVGATAKESSASGAPPRTSFMFSVRVGGLFQNIVLTAPGRNHFGFASQQKPTGGLSCGVQTLAGGGQRMVCALLLGQQEPPGTYRFGATFTSPLAPSATLFGSVTGIGPGAPKTFKVGTGR